MCATCNDQMDAIVKGHGSDPFAYRLLTPLIIVAFGNTLSTLIVFHLVSFGVFFALVAAWSARRQVDPALVMPLMTIAVFTMLPTWYFSFWTVTEWNLWISGLLLLPRWSLSAHSTAK